MIGTQRSGSNLLRVMLDAIDTISAPHPPHILQRFLPLLDLYGDLSNKENFRQLVEDICELVKRNPVPWEGICIEADKIYAECRQFSVYEIFRVIYENAAIQHGAEFWLCKSMKNMYYSEGIESTGIHPYYIYLYRDGRDVALSFQKAVVGEKHIYSLAKSWAADQREASLLKKRCPEDHFFSLSYEELLAAPENVLHRLCDFLHVSYTDKVMEFYNSRESKNTAEAGTMWQNVTRPILKGNTRKFMQELSAEEIAIFESVAGVELQKLGYRLVTPEDKLIDKFSDEQIREYSDKNEELKRQFKAMMPAEDLEKRKGQSELLEEIKNRRKR